MSDMPHNECVVDVEDESEKPEFGSNSLLVWDSSCGSSPLSTPGRLSPASNRPETSMQSTIDSQFLETEESSTRGKRPSTGSMTLSRHNPTDSGQNSHVLQRSEDRKRKNHEFLLLDEGTMGQEERKLKERRRNSKGNDRRKDVGEHSVLKNQQNPNRNKGAKHVDGEGSTTADDNPMENEDQDHYREAIDLLVSGRKSKVYPNFPHECTLPELSLGGNWACMEIPEFKASQPPRGNATTPETLKVGIPGPGERPQRPMPELWKDGETLFPEKGRKPGVTQEEFDRWVGPYFRDLRNYDREFLEAKGDLRTPFVVPELGRHYSKIWSKEDGSKAQRDNRRSEPPLEVLPIATNRDIVRHDFRPLSARLFALILPEDPEDSHDARSGGVEDESLLALTSQSGFLPGSKTYTTTLPDLEEIGFGITKNRPTDERLAQELRYLGFFDKNTTYAWNDTNKGTDIKTDVPKDEVTIRLNELQSILKNQCALNTARKERISEKMDRHLVHQDLLQRLEPLDKEIDSQAAIIIKRSLASFKRFRTNSKKTAALAASHGQKINVTRRKQPLSEPILEAMRKRELLIHDSKLTLNGEVLGVLSLENTFEKMDDLLERTKKELRFETGQNMTCITSHEAKDKERGEDGVKEKFKKPGNNNLLAKKTIGEDECESESDEDDDYDGDDDDEFKVEDDEEFEDEDEDVDGGYEEPANGGGILIRRQRR